MYGPQQAASEGPPQGQLAGVEGFLDMAVADCGNWEKNVEARIIRQFGGPGADAATGAAITGSRFHVAKIDAHSISLYTRGDRRIE